MQQICQLSAHYTPFPISQLGRVDRFEVLDPDKVIYTVMDETELQLHRGEETLYKYFSTAAYIGKTFLKGVTVIILS